MQRLVVPMEIKAVSAKGEFSGYASIFGNVDLGRDLIQGPEPFKEIVRNPDGKVRVLFAHDDAGYTPSAGLAIGLADVEQDEKGLKFDGQLVTEDPFVQRVHVHMKAKTLDGMSIGFDVLPGGAEFTEGGIRVLKAMRLWEISVVTFGMNPKARIENVKQRAGSITTIREFEDLLRDAGFPKAAAKSLAARGWAGLADQREADGDDGLKSLNWDFLKIVPL